MGRRFHPRPTTDRVRQEQLQRLLSRQDEVLRNRRQLLRESQPTGVMDEEDRSADAEEQGVESLLLALAAHTVQEIELALHRLEAGAFGTCAECRGRISEARLRALPFATLCCACQERQDRRVVPVDVPVPRRWNPRHRAEMREESVGP